MEVIVYKVNIAKDLYIDEGITYNNEGEPLTQYQVVDFPFTPHSLKKVPKPKKLRISLGQKCNYSCQYCLQDALSEKITYKDINKEVLSKLDLSDAERVELWGGEPFIYWYYMKQIIDELDKEGLEWLIVTNGSLLEQKHVNYFKSKKSKFLITVSHDGPGQELLRGEDVLPEKAQLLTQLKDFATVSFNTIISNQNFDLFAIAKFFNPYNLNNNYELAEAYDYKGMAYVIQGENLEKYDQILRKYLVESKQSNSFKQDLRHHIEFIMKPHKKLTSTRCGIDCEEFLTIDLQGNIKPCQNVGTEYISGNVADMSKVELKKIKFNGMGKCRACEVKDLCMSHCPLIQDINIFNANCLVNKVHYKAIQDTAYQVLFQEVIL